MELNVLGTRDVNLEVDVGHFSGSTSVVRRFADFALFCFARWYVTSSICCEPKLCVFFFHDICNVYMRRVNYVHAVYMLI